MGEDADLLQALDDPPPYRSAGVLPVAAAPSGELFCLLGKEESATQWRGSRRWAPFTGGREEGETVEAAAAREFVEESLACVRVTADPHEWQTAEPVQQLLEQGSLLQARLWRANAAGSRALFVLPVPWQPHAPARFAATRALVDSYACSFGVRAGEGRALGHPALAPHANGVVTVRPCMLEKKTLCWFSLDALQAVVDSNGLHCGGLSGTQYFRSDTVPLLSVLLPHLRGGAAADSSGLVVVRPWK